MLIGVLVIDQRIGGSRRLLHYTNILTYLLKSTYLSMAAPGVAI